MDSFPVELHSEALEELAEQFEYLQVRAGLRVAESFWNQLQECLARIVEDPERHPEYREGTRRIRFRKYPYSVVYELEQTGRPFVWSVMHHRRESGYWQSRTR